MLIRMLSARTSPINSFLHPIKAFAKEMNELGLTVKIHHKFDESLGACDVLCIVDQRCRGSRLNRNPPNEIETAKRSREQAKTLVWFDTADSTGQTSFEVLPYVDLYAKCFVLKDRVNYAHQSYSLSSRVWASYYYELKGIEDKQQKQSWRRAAQTEELYKIAVSWNRCGLGHNYMALKRWQWQHLLRTFRPQISFRAHAITSKVERDIHISYRASMHSKRMNFISFQREETRRQLAEIAANTTYTILYQGKIPNRQYNSEMHRALIIPSPFGTGEVCFREFECFLAGATLVKPDVSHLESWPNYYEPGVTYVPHAWDFSDFQAKVMGLIESPDIAQTIAQAGQDRYLESLSTAGGAAFAEHFAALIQKAVSNSRGQPSKSLEVQDSEGGLG